MIKKFFVGYGINASYSDLCTALDVSSGSRMKIGLEI